MKPVRGPATLSIAPPASLAFLPPIGPSPLSAKNTLALIYSTYVKTVTIETSRICFSAFNVPRTTSTLSSAISWGPAREFIRWTKEKNRIFSVENTSFWAILCPRYSFENRLSAMSLKSCTKKWQKSSKPCTIISMSSTSRQKKNSRQSTPNNVMISRITFLFFKNSRRVWISFRKSPRRAAVKSKHMFTIRCVFMK